MDDSILSKDEERLLYFGLVLMAISLAMIVVAHESDSPGAFLKVIAESPFYRHNADYAFRIMSTNTCSMMGYTLWYISALTPWMIYFFKRKKIGPRRILIGRRKLKILFQYTLGIHVYHCTGVINDPLCYIYKVLRDIFT